MEKCFKQLVRAQSAICDGQIKTKTTRKIIPIIIVDDPIPNLDSILYYSNFLGEQRPYIISTYELDIIAYFTDKKDFINFVSQRIEVSKKGVMFCSDELDYFVFYKLRGFENYIDLNDFREIFVPWPDNLDSKMEGIIEKKGAENPSRYGREKTLIAVSI